MKFLINPNYNKAYNLFYKKMPIIAAITTMAIAFIWSIIDTSVNRVTIGYYSKSIYYGIMRLDTAFLCLLTWWIIGAVLAIAAWFFTTISISATIVRTDIAIQMSENADKNNI